MKKLFLLFIFTLQLFAYEVFIDKNNSSNKESIFNQTHYFKTIEKKSIGISQQTVWLKINVENTSSRNIEKHILFQSKILDNIKMIYENEDKIILEKNQSSKIKNSFSIELKPLETKVLYFKINSSHIIDLSYKIFSNHEDMITYNHSQASISFFIFGAMLLIIFLMFILVLFNNDIVYKVYLGLLLSTFLSQFFMGGFIKEFIYLEDYTIYIKVLIDFMIIFIFLFLSSILELKKYAHSLYIVSRFFIISFLIILLLEPLYIFEFVQFRINIFIPISILFMFIIIIYSLVKKLPYSKFIFVGWLFYLSSGLILNSYHKGLVQTDNYFIYWQLGTLFEAITFLLLLLYRIKKLYEEKLKNEQQLLIRENQLQKQSKLATLGDNLAHIEHQWRSPLSKISSHVMKLQSELEFKGMPTKEKLSNSLNNISDTLLSLKDLVDKFKNFYSQESTKSYFFIDDAIDNSIKLLDFSLNKNNITINRTQQEIKFYGCKTEFTQAIVNIISNAEDIFIERKTLNPHIEIRVSQNEKTTFISIQDNAGGIEENNITKIFDKFYSNKKNRSTGIGLYLVKNIIEKLNGKIDVINFDNGAKFIIQLPKE